MTDIWNKRSLYYLLRSDF